MMIRKGRKCIQLCSLARMDINWWYEFAISFNGSSLINNYVYPVPIFTDASKEGFAAVMGADWVAGSWKEPMEAPWSESCNHIAYPPSMDSYNEENINELELWAVVVAVKRWLCILKDSTVDLFTDNMQVLYAIMNGRARNPTFMAWIRELFWIGLINNTRIVPHYVRSADNVVADTLSRLPYRKTRNSAPHLLAPYGLCCESTILEYCRSGSGVIDGDDREVQGGLSGPGYPEDQERPMDLLPEIL